MSKNLEGWEAMVKSEKPIFLKKLSTDLSTSVDNYVNKCKTAISRKIAFWRVFVLGYIIILLDVRKPF